MGAKSERIKACLAIFLKQKRHQEAKATWGFYACAGHPRVGSRSNPG